jgi:pentalenene oxygenase
LPTQGDLVEIRLGSLRAVVPCHPELIWQVLTDDRTFDKGGWMYDKARALLGNALPLCRRRDHREQRRLIQPAFRSEHTERYSRIMTDEIEDMTARWCSRQVIDVHAAMFEMALRVTCRTLLCSTITDTDAEAFRRIYATALRSYLPRLLLPERLQQVPLPGIGRSGPLCRELTRCARQLIARHGATTGETDLVPSLLAAQRTATTVGKDAADIDVQLLPLLMAGADTTAATLSWALHLLTEYPAVQERLREEADPVLHGRPAQWQDLQRLPYATCIVTETLRLYPPTWLLTRETTADVQLGDHHLRAGSTVLFSSVALHRNPKIYASPHTFAPDRWDPEHAAHRPRGAFVAFGAGPRVCIGEHYALVEATLALATIANRWSIQKAPGSDARPTPLAALLHPRRLLVTVQHRAPHAVPPPVCRE